MTSRVLLARAVAAYWLTAPRANSRPSRDAFHRVFPLLPRRRRSFELSQASSRGLRSHPGLHRVGPRWSRGATNCPSPGVSVPTAHSGEWVRITRVFLTRHLPPLEFETPLAACSPSRLPPIFQSGALVGFTLQGFAPPAQPHPLSETVAFMAFHEATGTVLGRWTDGTASRRGPWNPQVQTARPPSRHCSTREPVSVARRLGPAMGRSPPGFHPP